MKMSDITNSRGPSSVVIQSTSVQKRPYIARGGYTNTSLTNKEREARRQGLVGRTAHTKTAFSMDNVGGANVAQAGASSFFSPQLSTDFLELPQTLRERRELYKHYYDSDPLVGQAIDLHTELPLSKVRLAIPKPRTCPERFKSPDSYGKYIHSFFEKMCQRTKLFQRLLTATHHYWLDGCIGIFAEDSDVEVPSDVGHRISRVKQAVLRDDGQADEYDEEFLEELPDREEREGIYYQKKYNGWDKIIIIPADQVKLTTFNFTDKVRIELIPTDQDKALVEQAKNGDPRAEEMVAEIPADVRQHIEEGNLIPLGTDPDEGSFCYMLHARRGAGDEMGSSILNRCLRTLTYREKLRQAQTQIASRAMTPKRLVYADGLSDVDVDELREQIDLALVDPDYSIVTNFEVHWEEIGSKDRLLDLSGEYEVTDKQLYAGLGVTESLLNGESTFSGDRVKLEVLNTRYLLFREIIQEYVEEYLFKPVARRKGFVEDDEWGDEVVIFPKLSFTRLALRDSQDTFDALFNLYQKGSVSIDLILEMFNIDPQDTREKLEKGLFTMDDALFNEVLRGTYSEASRELVEKYSVTDKIAAYLKLKEKPKEEEAAPEPESRF